MSRDLLPIARQFVGVPFLHQCRNPAVGVDCIGLGVLYLRACGYRVRDRTDYSRDPDGTLRAALCATLGDPVGEGDGCWKLAQPGDMLAVRFVDRAGIPERHVAIASTMYGAPAMIHADSSHREVVEHPLDVGWQRRVIGVWRVA